MPEEGSTNSSTDLATGRAPASRHSRKHTKSRTGCKRCKEKRLKCDESKPGCLKCKKKNVDCPGYAGVVLQWSAKYERFQSQHTATTPRSADDVDLTLSGQEASSTMKYVDGLHENVTEPQDNTVSQDQSPMLGYLRSGTYESDANLPISEATSMRRIPNIDSPLSVLGIHASSPMGSSYQDSEKRLDDSATNQWLLSINLENVERRLSSVPKFLIHMPTVLVDHYFDSVCTIFSTFDNSMNPFRSVVEGLWNGWAPLYYTIQSMAAAYLSNDFPHMRKAGQHLQSEAYRCLHESSKSVAGADMQGDGKTLLTIIMLGLTTSWHKGDDLGQSHLQAATRLFRKRLSQQDPLKLDSQEQRQNQFFEQCIVYWEMVSAVVSDGAMEMIEGANNASVMEALFEDTATPPSNGVLAFPHPWTGVTPNILSLFARTGRLVRQTRQIHHSLSLKASSLDFLSLDSAPPAMMDLEEASNKSRALEEELLAFSAPSTDDLVDTGDLRTPLDHFLEINECYRCASLLLIYRNFPDLLHERLPLNEASVGLGAWHSSYLQGLSGPQPQERSDRNWITSLAIVILKALEKLPISSGTRFLQPILLLVTASELCFPVADIAAAKVPGIYSQPSLQNIDGEQIEIARARRFVMLRLHELQISLPMRPIARIQRIIKETWQRLDAGRYDFWLDVMTEKRWETICG